VSDTVVLAIGDFLTLANVDFCGATSNSTYNGSTIAVSDAFTGPEYTVYIEPSASARGITVTTEAASDGSPQFKQDLFVCLFVCLFALVLGATPFAPLLLNT